MSGVMCHVSGVRCHVYFFGGEAKVLELVGGGSDINKAYPVLFSFFFNLKENINYKLWLFSFRIFCVFAGIHSQTLGTQEIS